MRVTVTINQITCFVPEDDRDDGDEFYLRARIYDRGNAGASPFKESQRWQMTAGSTINPNLVILRNEAFVPGRSILQLQAWDEDRLAATDLGEEAAIPGASLALIFAIIVDLFDFDDFLGGRRQRLHMPPVNIVGGVPQIAPQFAAGIPGSFRANRDGADYLVMYTVAYAW